MLNPDELLTEAEAAKQLRRSRLWLQRLRLEKKGPTFIMLGNRPHYDPADISAWLVSQKQNPTDEATL